MHRRSALSLPPSHLVRSNGFFTRQGPVDFHMAALRERVSELTNRKFLPLALLLFLDDIHKLLSWGVGITVYIIGGLFRQNRHTNSMTKHIN